MNILVINGHKYYPFAQGKLNSHIYNKIIEFCSPNNEINTTIIDNGYEIQQEVEKYLWSDIIIFQSPVNWYYIPWSFKKYIDEVYKAGAFYTASDKYGHGGNFTQKKYMLSLTAASSIYEFENTNGFFDFRDIDDIFIGFHKTHQYCGMQKLKTFIIYNVYHNLNIIQEENRIKEHIEKYVLK